MPNHDDVLAVTNLISESQYLIDVGRWDELVTDVFAEEVDGVVPEASFGFATWRGKDELMAGYGASLPNFEGAAHAVSNLHLTIDGDTAHARYYIHAWHWLKVPAAPRNGDNADFMLLGIMTDDFIRQAGEWRLLRRTLERFGPGPAVGTLAPFLKGLGDS